MLKKSIAFILALIIALTTFAILPASAEEVGEDGLAEATASGALNQAPTAVPSQAPTAAAPAPTQAPTQAATAAPTDAPKVIDYPVVTDIQNLSEGVKLTWNKYAGNATYRVYYRKAAVYSGTWEEKYGSTGWTRLATVTGNTYTHKSPADAEIGVYTVRAVDSKGNFTSNYNTEGWENSFYSAPVISSISFDESGVHIAWVASWKKHGFHNGERYIVYRKTSGSGWIRVKEDAESVFTDNTASPDTAYTYTLRLIDEEGKKFLSGYDAGKTVSFGVYPYLTSIANTETGAKLSWQKFTGAAKYRVYCRSGNSWTRLGQVTGTSFIDTTVKNGETRVYTVRALNSSDSFVSDFNKDGWSNTFFAAPVIQTLTGLSDGVKLTWSRTEGAGLYRVYRKTSSGWQRLTQTNASEYTDRNVTTGTTYTYTLRIVDPETESFMSDYTSGKSIKYVSAPSIKNIENTKTGAKLTWDAVPGAEVYRVYYKNASGSWTRLASKYAPEYVDTSVGDGETREYTIRCLDSKGNFVSDYLREGYVNTFFAAPELDALTVENGSVSLSWKVANGAQRFRVYRRTSDTGWARLGETAQGSYADNTAKKGVKYTYTVRMISSDGSRFVSDYLSGRSIVICDTPALTSAAYSSTGVVLKWNAVKNADYYRVYYKSAAGGWTRLTTQSATSYTDTSVKDGETRYYTVRCSDKEGNLNSDYDRTGLSYSYFAAPKITSVKYGGGRYSLTWTKTDGVAGYRIYRKVYGEKDWTAIANMHASASYTDSLSLSGKIVAYTLRAQNASGALISSFVSDNPYYKNGSVVNGVFTEGGSTYRFISGIPAKGYYTESGNLYYYNNGKRVSQTNYTSKARNASYNRAWWLCEVMKAAGYSVDVSPSDYEAVYDLAYRRGVISSYTYNDMYLPLNRGYVAFTIVNAFDYPDRGVGYISDITSYDEALATVAYYGYFIPDRNNRLYPTAEITESEMAYLLSELDLYRRLKGKSVLSFGDSIMYGAGNDDHSLSRIIAEKYGMSYTDYSEKGSAVGDRSGRGHIPNQVRRAIKAGKKADVILVNGGTNDMNHTALGTINSGYDMSGIGESSFTDGFEKMMWMISDNWKDVPVIYIRAHNMVLGSDEKERRFGDRGIELAEKWHAAAIDLYNDSDFNAENNYIAERYTLMDGYEPDTIHPNALGYAEFYLPPITDSLLAAFG